MQASRKRLQKIYQKKGGEKDPGSQAQLEINYKTKEHLYNLVINKNPLPDKEYKAEEDPLPYLFFGILAGNYSQPK